MMMVSPRNSERISIVAGFRVATVIALEQDHRLNRQNTCQSCRPKSPRLQSDDLDCRARRIGKDVRVNGNVRLLWTEDGR